jgi:hypothetical protein
VIYEIGWNGRRLDYVKLLIERTTSAALDAGGAVMTMEQTLSDQAQLTTIAFGGLAFRGFQVFREFRVPSDSRFNVLRVPKVLCNW